MGDGTIGGNAPSSSCTKCGTPALILIGPQQLCQACSTGQTETLHADPNRMDRYLRLLLEFGGVETEKETQAGTTPMQVALDFCVALQAAAFVVSDEFPPVTRKTILDQLAPRLAVIWINRMRAAKEAVDRTNRLPAGPSPALTDEELRSLGVTPLRRPRVPRKMGPHREEAATGAARESDAQVPVVRPGGGKPKKGGGRRA